MPVGRTIAAEVTFNINNRQSMHACSFMVLSIKYCVNVHHTWNIYQIFLKLHTQIIHIILSFNLISHVMPYPTELEMLCVSIC